MRHRARRALLWGGKAAVTLMLLAWLAGQVDVPATVASLEQIGAATFITALGLHVAAILVMSARWWLLLRRGVSGAQWRKVLPSYYLGVFFNLMLPSGVGGDAARTVHLGWGGMRLQPLIASLLMDRAIGLMTVIVLGAAGVLLLPHGALGVNARATALLALLSAAAGLGLYFWPGLQAWFGRRAKASRRRSARIFLELAEACCAHREDPHGFFFIVLLSVCAQLMVFGVYLMLAGAIGIDLPLQAYLPVLSIVFLAAALPISIGGLGVRESVLVGLLVTLGVDTQAGTALSLAYLLTLWSASLPGALVLLTLPRHANREQHS